MMLEPSDKMFFRLRVGLRLALETQEKHSSCHAMPHAMPPALESAAHCRSLTLKLDRTSFMPYSGYIEFRLELGRGTARNSHAFCRGLQILFKSRSDHGD